MEYEDERSEKREREMGEGVIGRINPYTPEIRDTPWLKF